MVRHDPHLGVVDAPRHHSRNIRQARRQTPKNVGASATVTVHDVRLLLFQELRQTVGKRQVQVAGAEEIVDADAMLSGDRIDPRIGRTNQDALVAPLP